MKTQWLIEHNGITMATSPPVEADIDLSPGAFMRHAAAPPPVNSNTAWGAAYAGELRNLITEAAARAPRSLQRHLGPSELGQPCDRQVVAKMANLPRTNHVSDPWPSIMGTAGHGWMEEAFRKVDEALPARRFLVESKVYPDDTHPGTGDLYDAARRCVLDWKFLGPTTLGKLRRRGPSTAYFYQLLLYRRGFQRLGLPVDHVVLAALPRTESSLAGMYLWTHTPTPDDDAAVDALLARTELRHQLATEVHEGRLDIMAVPATPDDDVCIWCPLYRPESAFDGLAGCPGGRLPKGE